MSWPRRWGNAFCKGLYFCVAGILCSVTATAQYPIADTVTRPTTTKHGRALRVAADINWSFTISADELFTDYQYYLGGHASGFDIPTGVGFTIGSYQFNDAYIGLSSGYYKAAVRETYTYDPESRTDPIGPEQTVTQTMLLTVIPSMVVFDYHPQYKQFTGYLGGGLGVAAVHLFWEEVLSPSASPGARKSGVRYDDWQPAPIVNLHAGVSLGFDQLIGQKSRSGLFFEVAYQWIPVTAPVFAGTASSIQQPMPELQHDYTIYAGGIVLRFGFEIMLSGG